MKRAVVFFMCFGLILSSCRTWYPIRPNDHTIELRLEAAYIKEHVESDYLIDIDKAAARACPYDLIGLVPIIGLINLVEAVFVGRDVHVYPIDYRDEYQQQLYVGRNKVFLPRRFGARGGWLIFEVTGTHKGCWRYRYIPGKRVYVPEVAADAY